MNSGPRNHHYIPQFYLKGFTTDGAKESQLSVLDLKERRQWAASVEKTATQTYLYRVRLKNGGDPAVLEKGLASVVEDKLAPILQRVISGRSLPKGQDFELLMNLVVLMILRVPAFMSFCKGVAASQLSDLSRSMVATPEAWKAIISEMKAAGIESPDVPFEDMKEFVESNDCVIDAKLDANWLVSIMHESSGTILLSLLQRNWYLTVASDDAPDFICSDNPVSLSRTKMCSPLGGVGLDAPGTLMLFPLNRRMVLVGSFEGIMLPSPAPEKTIALVNSATCRNAERFLFSPANDFIWLDKKREIRQAKDLLAAEKI